MLLNLLVPVKRFLLGVPWPWLILLVTLAGWQLGRWKLAALCFLLSVFILVNNLWEEAMITIYLCGVRSEEHTSELQSLMRISYAVFCLKKKRTRLITSRQTMLTLSKYQLP